MTLDQARSRAFAILERSAHILRSGPPRDQTLPPAVREVFTAYDKVTFMLGDILELGGQQQGLVEVGTTSDGTHLLVRHEDGGLFEWDDGVVPSSCATPDLPSLFHWIASQA